VKRQTGELLFSRKQEPNHGLRLARRTNSCRRKEDVLRGRINETKILRGGVMKPKPYVYAMIAPSDEVATCDI